MHKKLTTASANLASLIFNSNWHFLTKDLHASDFILIEPKLILRPFITRHFRMADVMLNY